MNNTNTPYAEAKVQFRNQGDVAWADSIDVDPIQLPVEAFVNPGVPRTTDVFDSGLIGLMDAICAWESLAPVTTYRLVWSDTETAVMGMCPVCDEEFPVSEGMPGDELNEGFNAVTCGCDPRDQDCD